MTLNKEGYCKYYCENCKKISSPFEHGIFSKFKRTDKLDIIKCLLNLTPEARNYKTFEEFLGRTSYKKCGTIINWIKDVIDIFITTSWKHFKLSGNVSADHMFVGALKKYLRGFRTATKHLVLGFVEILSYVRIFIPVDRETIVQTSEVMNHVLDCKKTILTTDYGNAFNGWKELGIKDRKKVNHSGVWDDIAQVIRYFKQNDIHTNDIEQSFGLFKQIFHSHGQWNKGDRMYINCNFWIFYANFCNNNGSSQFLNLCYVISLIYNIDDYGNVNIKKKFAFDDHTSLYTVSYIIKKEKMDKKRLIEIKDEYEIFCKVNKDDIELKNSVLFNEYTYLVKWENYSHHDNSWEPCIYLNRKLIDDFEALSQKEKDKILKRWYKSTGRDEKGNLKEGLEDKSNLKRVPHLTISNIRNQQICNDEQWNRGIALLKKGYKENVGAHIKKAFPYPSSIIRSKDTKLIKRKVNSKIKEYIIFGSVKSSKDVAGQDPNWKVRYNCSVHVNVKGKIFDYVCECSNHRLSASGLMCKHCIALIVLRIEKKDDVLGLM